MKEIVWEKNYNLYDDQSKETSLETVTFFPLTLKKKWLNKEVSYSMIVIVKSYETNTSM